MSHRVLLCWWGWVWCGCGPWPRRAVADAFGVESSSPGTVVAVRRSVRHQNE
ncbi:hypothetical protein FM106_07120 [Brachybacterium faecium]|nr:hypothetical protein FM106_07120 [Brachybacterium faecium]